MKVSEDLLTELGEEPFDLVVSTEVVEHLYSPHAWAIGCFRALRPSGTLVLSTPFHGWFKNVALAISGRLDDHHDALREGGTSSSSRGGPSRRCSRKPASPTFGLPAPDDYRFCGSRWSWRAHAL
jgi:hypothetical protein